MVIKRLLRPERARHLPTQFSWIDQRFVRHRLIELCDHSTLALYLFLITVSDGQGLSYYSDQSITQRLSMDNSELLRARQWLIQLDLIAYDAPLYQVLQLENHHD